MSKIQIFFLLQGIPKEANAAVNSYFGVHTKHRQPGVTIPDEEIQESQRIQRTPGSCPSSKDIC